MAAPSANLDRPTMHKFVSRLRFVENPPYYNSFLIFAWPHPSDVRHCDVINSMVACIIFGRVWDVSYHQEIY
jgi:hypothetical protein